MAGWPSTQKLGIFFEDTVFFVNLLYVPVIFPIELVHSREIGTFLYGT